MTHGDKNDRVCEARPRDDAKDKARFAKAEAARSTAGLPPASGAVSRSRGVNEEVGEVGRREPQARGSDAATYPKGSTTGNAPVAGKGPIPREGSWQRLAGAPDCERRSSCEDVEFSAFVARRFRLNGETQGRRPILALGESTVSGGPSGGIRRLVEEFGTNGVLAPAIRDTCAAGGRGPGGCVFLAPAGEQRGGLKKTQGHVSGLAVVHGRPSAGRAGPLLTTYDRPSSMVLRRLQGKRCGDEKAHATQ